MCLGTKALNLTGMLMAHCKNEPIRLEKWSTRNGPSFYGWGSENYEAVGDDNFEKTLRVFTVDGWSGRGSRYDVDYSMTMELLGELI